MATSSISPVYASVYGIFKWSKWNYDTDHGKKVNIFGPRYKYLSTIVGQRRNGLAHSSSLKACGIEFRVSLSRMSGHRYTTSPRTIEEKFIRIVVTIGPFVFFQVRVVPAPLTRLPNRATMRNRIWTSLCACFAPLRHTICRRESRAG